MSSDSEIIPPELCEIPEPDLELLESFKKSDNVVNIVYVGRVISGSDYMEVFLVYTKDAMLHILALRRLCQSQKISSESHASEIEEEQV